jgi:transposase
MLKSASPLFKGIQTYNLKQLAAIYGVSTKVMKSWLKPYHEIIGERFGKKYSPKNVAIIFEKLGVPQQIIESVD